MLKQGPKLKVIVIIQTPIIFSLFYLLWFGWKKSIVLAAFYSTLVCLPGIISIIAGMLYLLLKKTHGFEKNKNFLRLDMGTNIHCAGNQYGSGSNMCYDRQI